nr:hypothetical protein [Tanacetum cinerariifolium]
MCKKINNSNAYSKSLVEYDEFNDEGYKSEEDNGFNWMMIGKWALFEEGGGGGAGHSYTSTINPL